MNKRKFLAGVLALLLGVLPLAACGGGASAASMRLRKTEGTVAVQDDGGADVTPKENMSLHSGYAVATQAASYAWIDLDEVKLTKLDENSEAAVTQEGKALTLDVRAGNLYFDITEPLAEDETLDIRTSTMVTAIRGTRGWVTQESVCLLDGTVTVTAGEQSVTVSAGQMARLTPEGMLETAALDEGNMPAFVAPELTVDGEAAPAAAEGGEDDGTGGGTDSGTDSDTDGGTDGYPDGSAGLADLPQAYQDIIQRLGNGFAGLYDMDGDGSRELVICGVSSGDVVVGVFIYGTGGETPEELSANADQVEKDEVAELVERDGKLYVKLTNRKDSDDGDAFVTTVYFGPPLNASADAGAWGLVEHITGSDAAFAETESQYTVLRELFTIKDRRLVTGAP